jgi:alkylhydroperoxidase family enzyme
MTPGLNLYKTAPEAMKAPVELEDNVRQSELDLSLIDLVETRVSQINGCAIASAFVRSTRYTGRE